MISPLPASGPPDEVAAVRSQLLSLFAMLGKAGAAGGALPPAAAELSLTTRGLLRCADHAGQGLAAAEEVSAAVAREVAGRRGALSPSGAAALSAALRQSGLPPPPPPDDGGGPPPPPPRIEEDAATGERTLVIGSSRVGPLVAPTRPELVPSEFIFHDSAAHTACLERMLRDWACGHHMLLLGNQGVGKNKVTDRLLELLSYEREYMQLHRDTTVAALTQTPALTDGKLVWQDSPLVRAITHGRALSSRRRG